MAARRCIAALAAWLLLTGCGATSLDDDVPLVSARLVDGTDDVIEVEYSGCDDMPGTSLNETDEVVRIRIHGPAGGCEPLHTQRFELSSPLGFRRIIDDATGREPPDGS